MARISWLDYMSQSGRLIRGTSWNGIEGCTPVSGHPGCKHCYARMMAQRKTCPDHIKIAAWDGTTVLTDRLWMPLEKKPRRDGLPRIAFVTSMGDLWLETVTEDTQMLINGIMVLSQGWIFKDLTKRPKRMADFLLTHSPRECAEYVISPSDNLDWVGPTPPETWHDCTWIHRYASASDQRTVDEMSLELLRTPAAVRGLSLEPLVGPVDLETWLRPSWGELRPCAVGGNARPLLPPLDHLIIGCESGPRRRPCRLEWVNSLVEHATDAGCPVFVKQLDLDSRLVTELEDMPEDLRVRQQIGVPT